jgi:hypothetical protein
VNPPRRTEEIDQAYLVWAQALVLNRGKVLAVVSTLCTLLGAVISTAGWRAYGPPQELAAHTVKQFERDSVQDRRLSRLEEGADQRTERIRRLEESDELKMYMLCVVIRRIDPLATPPECGPVIQSAEGAQAP